MEDRLQQQGVLIVRKPFLLATLAASVALTVLAGMYASAQGPVRQPVGPSYGGSPIALVDISYIFKEHLRFKTKMNDMKTDVQRAEDSVKQTRSEIMRLAEQLQDLNPGTPDYKSLEAEVARRQADLAVGVQLQKKEFLQREAKVYYETYQEVLYEIDNYAKHNGISMVLRFNGDKANMDDPQSVLQHINKPVVWHTADRDITGFVLDQLNRGGSVGATQTPRVGGATMRPGVYTPRPN